MKDSRILKEWLDASGNQIKLSNTTANNAALGKGNFNSKFTKLYSHIESVWGGLNVLKCTAQTLVLYYGYGQEWYELSIRYIPEEGCFEIHLMERISMKLIFAGEADSWTELLDILMQTETIKNRKLCEWVDSNGNKASLNNSTKTTVATTNDLFKDRFIKLAKHIEDCQSWSLVNYISEWELDLEYEYNDETYSLDIDVNSKDISVTVYKNNSGREILNTTANHNEWSKILTSLWNKGIIKDTSLCEWVDKNGNKAPANTSAASAQIATTTGGTGGTPDFTEKFKKLIVHIKTKYVAHTIICGEHMLELIIVKPKLRLLIMYSPARKGFDVLIKDRSTENVIENTFVYGGWDTVLDVLLQNNIITDKKLCEWVDKSRNKSAANKSAVSNVSDDIVYIWDMYVDPKDKGTWCSAEKYNSEYDGYVYRSKESAYAGGFTHLLELEDEGRLRGDPYDYDVDAVAIPRSEVSDYTLKFSGL